MPKEKLTYRASIIKKNHNFYLHSLERINNKGVYVEASKRDMNKLADIIEAGLSHSKLKIKETKPKEKINARYKSKTTKKSSKTTRQKKSNKISD